MSEELEPQAHMGPKTHWPMPVSMGVMVAGGALILIPWFFTVEEGSPLHLLKVGVGVLGFIALCLGAYKRP